MDENQPTTSTDHLSDAQLDEQISHLEAQVGGRSSAEEKPIPEKPDFIGSEAHTKELEGIYDKLNAKTAAETEAKTPPTTSTESFNDAFRSSYEWQFEKTQAQRDEIKENQGLVDRIQANADAKFGTKLTKEKALEIALSQEANAQQGGSVPAEFAPAVEGVKQLYPNQAPHVSMQNYIETEHAVRAKPVETLGQLYTNATGQHPLEMAVQTARQYSSAEHRAFYEHRDSFNRAEAAAEVFTAIFPDSDSDAMVNALGQVKKTGNHGKDLKSAYDLMKRGNKPGRPRSYESTMRDTYERMNRK